MVYVPEICANEEKGMMNKTRQNKIDVEIPASIRAGIAIAKLLARKRLIEKENQIKEKESVYVYLSEIARHVLLGSLKPKPGVKVENVIENIIHKTVGG